MLQKVPASTVPATTAFRISGTAPTLTKRTLPGSMPFFLQQCNRDLVQSGADRILFHDRLSLKILERFDLRIGRETG